MDRFTALIKTRLNFELDIYISSTVSVPTVLHGAAHVAVDPVEGDHLLLLVLVQAELSLVPHRPLHRQRLRAQEPQRVAVLGQNGVVPSTIYYLSTIYLV